MVQKGLKVKVKSFSVGKRCHKSEITTARFPEKISVTAFKRAFLILKAPFSQLDFHFRNRTTQVTQRSKFYVVGYCKESIPINNQCVKILKNSETKWSFENATKECRKLLHGLPHLCSVDAGSSFAATLRKTILFQSKQRIVKLWVRKKCYVSFLCFNNVFPACKCGEKIQTTYHIVL